MRYFILALSFLLLLIRSNAQKEPSQNFGSFVGMPLGIKADELVDPNWKVRTAHAGASWEPDYGIKGNVFYNEDWNKGYILLSDNHIAKDISLRFNIYSNEIYFMLDSQVLVVSAAVPVSEFGIYKKNDPNNIAIFRCGYPAVNNNTTKTFYNVVVNAKIALLCHYEKRIMEATNSIGAFERKFIDSETWFIYNSSSNKIIPVKKNKNALVEALPEYADKIQSIIQQNNLKLKSDLEWNILLNKLSDEIQ